MSQFLFAIPALALFGAAPATQNVPLTNSAIPARVISPVPSICGINGSLAQGKDRSPQLRRLDELPRGEVYMAIYRRDARGCINPMLAREAIGAPRR